MDKQTTIIIDYDLLLARAANDINSGKSTTIIVADENDVRKLMPMLSDKVKANLRVKTTKEIEVPLYV